MRHSFPERSLFLQIMIGISSVALVSAMTGTGMMNSQPSEYQQIAYAQEVCEWSESSCVGDYMGDDAGASSGFEPQASATTPCYLSSGTCLATDTLLDDDGNLVCEPSPEADCASFLVSTPSADAPPAVSTPESSSESTPTTENTEPSLPTCDPRSGLTTYGCYCGSGDTCEQGYECPPINELDAICRQHDINYQGCSFLSKYNPNPFASCIKITRQADMQLCTDARNLSTDGMTEEAKRYRIGIMAIFCPRGVLP